MSKYKSLTLRTKESFEMPYLRAKSLSIQSRQTSAWCWSKLSAIETIHLRTTISVWSSSKSQAMRVLILGSRSTWTSSSNMISGGDMGLSEVMEMEEDDKDGEEDIVGLVFSDSLKGIKFMGWCW